MSENLPEDTTGAPKTESASEGLTEVTAATSRSTEKTKSSAPSGHSIIVNQRQKGNPILKHIRNVPWEFGVIVPDYELGRCSCALFLSLRYHNRYPDYIHSRLDDLGKSYDLRVLLVLNDVGTKGPRSVSTGQHDVSYELNQLAKICILADCTLIVAFSSEEAARYLEVYKAYENKPPTDIMPKTNTDYLSQMTDVLTSVKGVNKTDCISLLKHFKTLAKIIEADADQLSLCPGIGPMKAQRLYKTFNEPFLRDTKSTSINPKPSGSSENNPSTSKSTELSNTTVDNRENVTRSENMDSSDLSKKRRTESPTSLDINQELSSDSMEFDDDL